MHRDRRITNKMTKNRYPPAREGTKQHYQKTELKGTSERILKLIDALHIRVILSLSV
jgi:hypothetical protein